MATCVACGLRPVQTAGNPLDGYAVRGNLCEQCNRDELRARGLGELADRDERNARTARAFWRAVGVCVVVLVAVIVLGAVVGG